MDANAHTEQLVVERTQELEKERLLKFKGVIRGQQTERERIARDLHDTLTMQLINVKRLLEHNTNNDSVITEVDRTVELVRSISHNLAPYSLLHFGLLKAIEDICISFNDDTTINVLFSKNEIDETTR